MPNPSAAGRASLSSALPSTESSVMRLAHPLRCGVAVEGLLDLLQDYFGPASWEELRTEFRREGEMTGALIADMCAKPENYKLSQLVGLASRMPGGTEVGNTFAIAMYLRHALAPQPYFLLEDSLCELLENTDLGDDISMSMLNVPYSRFYVEFGKNRQLGLRLPNMESGMHTLEGAYLEKGRHPDYGEGLFIVLTGSPLGKQNAMDDATHSMFLPTTNPDLSLKEALLWTHAQAKALSRGAGLIQTPSNFIDPTLECLLFMTKALLYIGMAETRREVRNDYSTWKKTFAGIQSTGKKNKALRRARGLVDHVLITAPPQTAPAKTSSGSPPYTVEGHRRRGHMRMQAYGPKFSQRRVRLIMPMDINGGPAEDAPQPQYVVR